jgi:hypothetical protein
VMKKGRANAPKSSRYERDKFPRPVRLAMRAHSPVEDEGVPVPGAGAVEVLLQVVVAIEHGHPHARL